MSRDLAPFGLRMKPDLKSEIEKASKENGRSMNAEIVIRLEESIQNEKVEEGELLSAEEAKEIASRSKDYMKQKCLEFAVNIINRSIVKGVRSFYIDFEEILSGLNEDEISDYPDMAIDAIKAKGYKVSESEFLVYVVTIE